jgi:predicted dinucleotide-binding enzyme
MKFSPRTLLSGLIVWASALAVPVLVSAETIAVIGTGNVGGALGPAFATLGHDIIYGSRQPGRQDVQALVGRTGGDAVAMLPTEAAAAADIVVMATKWADAEVALKSLGDLSGKIILDPNNAVRVDSAGMRHQDVETSCAQLIQSWAPNSMVVKAFNTLSSETMANPSVAGGPVTIPIAGNDADAKAVIAGLVTGIGFEVVDMGDISAAHAIEQMLIVRGNAGTMGAPFNYYFRPVPQN